MHKPEISPLGGGLNIVVDAVAAPSNSSDSNPGMGEGSCVCAFFQEIHEALLGRNRGGRFGVVVTRAEWPMLRVTIVFEPCVALRTDDGAYDSPYWPVCASGESLLDSTIAAFVG